MSDTPFDIGEAVVDRDRTDPKPRVVVSCPPQTVDEWIAYTNTTVAEDNPDYPADALVIVVVYRRDLKVFDSDWADHNGPFSLAELNEAGVSHYAFPAPRLRSLNSEEDGETTEATDTTTVATATENEHERERESKDEPAEADPADDSKTEPSAAVRALEQRLSEGGMTTELEADGQTIRATKLGETYRLRPGTVLGGDGALRGRLEEIVAADQHATD
jgi:hypothetical protein